MDSFFQNVRHALRRSYRDPATLVLVTIAIGMVALVAASVPARRAVQVQPITALRCE